MVQAGADLEWHARLVTYSERGLRNRHQAISTPRSRSGLHTQPEGFIGTASRQRVDLPGEPIEAEFFTLGIRQLVTSTRHLRESAPKHFVE
jgi:hypothetical protein